MRAKSRPGYAISYRRKSMSLLSVYVRKPLSTSRNSRSVDLADGRVSAQRLRSREREDFAVVALLARAIAESAAMIWYMVKVLKERAAYTPDELNDKLMRMLVGMNSFCFVRDCRDESSNASAMRKAHNRKARQRCRGSQSFSSSSRKAGNAWVINW
jgi:hypothetical protein